MLLLVLPYIFCGFSTEFERKSIASCNEVRSFLLSRYGLKRELVLFYHFGLFGITFLSILPTLAC